MEKDKPPRWRLLTTGFLNAFENMAIDEAILKTCSQVNPRLPLDSMVGSPMQYPSDILNRLKATLTYRYVKD